MKQIFILAILLTATISCLSAQNAPNEKNLKKATEWVDALRLNDKPKEEKVIEIISIHLQAVEDWHNSHSYTLVPEGINPKTGEKLSTVDRQLIIDSTIDESVHEDLMSGLRVNLSEEQVETILDKYTIGKFAFTLKAYKEILPDMPQDIENMIISHLKQAREEAVDYKSMKEISAIFKIHKTQIELYLYQNGYNWKAIYKQYVDSLKSKKK